MTSKLDNLNEEKNFGEFRRKVRSAEVLSEAMEGLLLSLHFTGRVSVVMQNGRVLKPGYEEGYFHPRVDVCAHDDIAQKRGNGRESYSSSDRSGFHLKTK